MHHVPNYGHRHFGDIAPKLAELTDTILLGDIWTRPELPPRDRSIATVAVLIALNRTEQLPFHFQRARDNSIRYDELVELITHLAFYAGWPVAASALSVLRQFDTAKE